MHSCIYEGAVTHRRCEPVNHQFHYRLFMLYLDLSELPSLIGSKGLIGRRKYGSLAFLRGDHLFDHQQPLEREVRELVLRQTGTMPSGPIRLLTQVRCFGFYFSPLNLLYVYDQRDERVEYVLAEVNNTPWNERHCYVLWAGNGQRSANAMRYAHPKQLHVSPFFGMDMEYRWQLTDPGSNLTVQLSNYHDAKQLFTARMSLQRRALNRRELRRMTFRYPMMTAQISLAIYYQALKLWWKRCPLYTHPSKQNRAPLPTRPRHERLAAAAGDDR